MLGFTWKITMLNPTYRTFLEMIKRLIFVGWVEGTARIPTMCVPQLWVSLGRSPCTTQSTGNFWRGLMGRYL
jgi:hypothetical protein